MHGIERSGTNCLELLLEQSFEMKVHCNRKHWRIVSQKLVDDDEGRYKNNLHIFLIKNPWAWYKSFTLKRMSRIEAQFNITNRLISRPTMEKSFETYWNPTNESFIDFVEKHPKDSILITYIEMIENGWKKAIEKIASHFALEIKNKEESLIKGREVSANRKISGKKFNYSYYKQREYLKEIQKEKIKWIKNNASQKVMDCCSFYDILEKRD